jgi:hypothetical protein
MVLSLLGGHGVFPLLHEALQACSGSSLLGGQLDQTLPIGTVLLFLNVSLQGGKLCLDLTNVLLDGAELAPPCRTWE